MTNKYLHKELERFGIKSIWVADDNEANLNSAHQMAQDLSNIRFEFYLKGNLIIEQIIKRDDKVDLVLTDLKMEDENAGVRVVRAAWEYLTPAFLVSGGKDHDRDFLWIKPPYSPLPLGTTKEDPEDWEMALGGVLSRSSTILGNTLKAKRKKGIALPDKLSGKLAEGMIGALDGKIINWNEDIFLKGGYRK